MRNSSLPRIRRRRWIHHLGRTLAIVIQLAFLAVPMLEGREERVLSSHAEAPRTAPHPGHHPDWCPACQMLSTHGLAQSRAELPDYPSIEGACPLPVTSGRAGVGLTRTNCSRAPPTLL